ncbi:putative 4-hydroxyphenylpyruvate dioxygenase [Helianthus anomalus]
MTKTGHDRSYKVSGESDRVTEEWWLVGVSGGGRGGGWWGCLVEVMVVAGGGDGRERECLCLVEERRPTIFIEIIQRIGCMLAYDSVKVRQKPGCGGFGKGNIAELFKSVEEYEKTHVINN